MKLMYIGIAAPAAPISAPDTVHANSLSCSVGTPKHSAASSLSRIARRPRPRRLDAHHRGKRADAEERGSAEIQVSGVAAQDVPGRGEDDELGPDEAGVEEVLVRSAQSRACGERTRHRHADPEFHRPKSP